mgnify:CR=1 FL=1
MSKPISKKYMEEIKKYVKVFEDAGDHGLVDVMNTLIAEVERLKKLAKPNRPAKTRRCAKPHVDGYTMLVSGMTNYDYSADRRS